MYKQFTWFTCLFIEGQFRIDYAASAKMKDAGWRALTNHRNWIEDDVTIDVTVICKICFNHIAPVSLGMAINWVAKWLNFSRYQEECGQDDSLDLSSSWLPSTSSASLAHWISLCSLSLFFCLCSCESWMFSVNGRRARCLLRRDAASEKERENKWTEETLSWQVLCVFSFVNCFRERVLEQILFFSCTCLSRFRPLRPSLPARLYFSHTHSLQRIIFHREAPFPLSATLDSE